MMRIRSSPVLASLRSGEAAWSMAISGRSPWVVKIAATDGISISCFRPGDVVAGAGQSRQSKPSVAIDQL